MLSPRWTVALSPNLDVKIDELVPAGSIIQLALGRCQWNGGVYPVIEGT